MGFGACSRCGNAYNECACCTVCGHPPAYHKPRGCVAADPPRKKCGCTKYVEQNPGYHTPREKRQAQHIIDGYTARGVPLAEATRIAWATVNKYRNNPAEAPAAEIAMGMKVESEHGKGPAETKKIVMDHLREHPRYYSVLATVFKENPPAGKVGSPHYKATQLERTKKQCPYTMTFTAGEWSAIKSIRKNYQWAQDIFDADVVEERTSDGQVLVRMSTASGFALQESVEEENLAMAGDSIIEKVVTLLGKLV